MNTKLSFPNRSLLLRVLMGISKSNHKRTHGGEAVRAAGPPRIAKAPPKIHMIFFTKVSEIENKHQSFPINGFLAIAYGNRRCRLKFRRFRFGGSCGKIEFGNRIWKSHMSAQVSQIPVRWILQTFIFIFL